MNALHGLGNCNHYLVEDRRAREVQVQIPSITYPVVELIVPFESSADGPWWDMFECWLGADFTGDPEGARIGDAGSGWGGESYFSGWLVWLGQWTGGPVAFSYRRTGIERGQWGMPELHEHYVTVHLAGYPAMHGGFDFAEPGGSAYRNGEWEPIGMEWNVFWHW